MRVTFLSVAASVLRNELELQLNGCPARLWCRSLWSQLITWLSFAINIVMLATWNARASLSDRPLYKNDTEVPESLTE